VFIILNFVTCIPVLLILVHSGMRRQYFGRSHFPLMDHSSISIYHFYRLFGNSTTVEGWEKDKVATVI